MNIRVFIILSVLLVLSATFSSAAIVNPKICRSDVKGYCAYSTPKEAVERGGKKSFWEFAAESQSFVVPGIEFLQISGNASLGDILIKLYTWFLGLVGISAVLMFIWGGIGYATATEGGVKEARQKIANAAWGLALALLAYLGLITINPDFVKKLNIETLLEPITMGGGVGKEACVDGDRCTDISKNCSGTWVCNEDGTQKECRTGTDCKNEDNPGECFASVKCPNGIVQTFHKSFRSAQACDAGCANTLKNACEGFEEFEIISISCGTPKLPGP